METSRIEKLEKAAKNWNTFYQCSEIENRGYGDRLSESIAKWMIDRCDEGLFVDDAIAPYVRQRYNECLAHRRQLDKFLKTEKHKPEHNVEYALFKLSQGKGELSLNRSVGDIGVVLDHQVPLVDDTRSGVVSHGGEIDLLSYSAIDNTLYILELKEPQSGQSLLKCVVEAYTYFRRIGDVKEFKRQFGVPCDANVVIAPLFFLGSAQHKGMLNITIGKRHRLALFKMINEDMKSRLNDKRCKIAFAMINRTDRFTLCDPLEDVSVSVISLDEI